LNQEEKSLLITELQEKLKTAKVALVARYQGLTVAKTNQLRRELRSVSGECRVAKNTLTKRALEGTELASVERWLEGQTTLVFGYEDPMAVTKIVARWVDSEAGKFSLKGGVYEGEILEPAGVVALSKTPSKEVLRGQLLGVLQAVASRFVRTVNEPGARLARLLASRQEQLGDAAE
jgi:large subunit ribosomal protein L10